MSISFRDRKNGRSLDASFFLSDGPKHGDVSKWHVGDGVSVLFEIDRSMVDAINENVTSESGVRANCDFGRDKGMVHVRCVVVQRHHACVWKEVGNLQDLGTSVVLEAISGQWEDVLRWVVLDERPVWVPSP